MADAGMQYLGEIDGKNVYWAEPGRFETPGIYFWDGKRNVHVPVPKVDGDCINPDISQASFSHLAAELVRRGATVTPAPHGGDDAAATEAPADAAVSDRAQLVSIATRIQIGTAKEGAEAVAEIIDLCAKAAKAA